MTTVLEDILGADGAIARRLDERYEFRPQQMEMATAVASAIEQGRHLLVEAGTEPAILVADCNPRLIEETRRNWPFLRDRRIDAYAPILSRYLGAE